MDGEATGFFPFFDVGVQFFLDKVADCAAQFFVFLSEKHGSSLSCSIVC
jgi:hypothetical protein